MATGVPEFAARLQDVARDQDVLLRNLFVSSMVSEDQHRSIRLHVLKADANGRPQVGLLVKHLCDLVLDYCIPRKQILEALGHHHKTGSTNRIAALHTEARRLFTDISNTGEGGELLLFVLTESVLGYRQVLSKMALKTSNRMHVHGLDGVYVSCNASSTCLRLHFGESKLHKDPAGSVRQATTSVASMLNDEGFLGAARRDYYLLNTQVDLGDPQLEDALLGFLDPTDHRFLSPEVCAVLLAGHEISDYPSVQDEGHLPTMLVKDSNNLVAVLESAATQHGIERFHIDLFLVPFPDLESFRNLLLKELGLK